MIYLIGTNHELQYTNEPAPTRRNRIVGPSVIKRARNHFQQYLREKSQELEIVLLAEEMIHFVLVAFNTQSIVAVVAEELGIEHRLCDIEPEERDRLGIGHSIDHNKHAEKEIREHFWLDRISDKRGAPVLFVCGSDHVDSFAELLRNDRWEPHVLERYWGHEMYE